MLMFQIQLLNQLWSKFNLIIINSIEDSSVIILLNSVHIHVDFYNTASVVK